MHRAHSQLVAEPELHLLSVTTKGGPTRLEGKGAIHLRQNVRGLGAAQAGCGQQVRAGAVGVVWP